MQNQTLQKRRRQLILLAWAIKTYNFAISLCFSYLLVPHIFASDKLNITTGKINMMIGIISVIFILQEKKVALTNLQVQKYKTRKAQYNQNNKGTLEF